MRLKHGCLSFGEYGLNVSSDNYAQHGIPLIRTSDFDDQGKLNLEGAVRIPSDLASGKMLQSGDVLFSRSGTVGRCMVFDDDRPATFAAYLVRFRPNPMKVDTNFLFYWSQSEHFSRQIRAETVESTIGNFNAKKIANLVLPEIDLSQQRQVSSFLDRETGKIDQLIEAKRKLVTLMEERRIATISRGIFHEFSQSNNRPTKQPRLRHLIRLNPPKPSVSSYGPNQEVSFIPMEVILDGLGGLAAIPLRPIGELWNASYCYFERGDLLLAKVTPCFENGKKALTDDLPTRIGFATTEVHVVRIMDNKVYPKYLSYVFSTKQFSSVGISSMTGAGGLRRVSEEAILNFRLPVLDVAMQERIALHLDAEIARINTLIDKTIHSISLLQELRSSLITAAVNGQIDINSWNKHGETERRLEAMIVEGEGAAREEGQST